jgi:hypothetical protein
MLVIKEKISMLKIVFALSLGFLMLSYLCSPAKEEEKKANLPSAENGQVAMLEKNLSDSKNAQSAMEKRLNQLQEQLDRRNAEEAERRRLAQAPTPLPSPRAQGASGEARLGFFSVSVSLPTPAPIPVSVYKVDAKKSEQLQSDAKKLREEILSAEYTIELCKVAKKMDPERQLTRQYEIDHREAALKDMKAEMAKIIDGLQDEVDNIQYQLNTRLDEVKTYERTIRENSNEYIKRQAESDKRVTGKQVDDLQKQLRRKTEELNDLRQIIDAK